MSWDDVCRLKKARGLGIHKIKPFNIALLGKQLWNLLLAKSEWEKITWSKYLHGADGIRDVISNDFNPPNGSVLWNSMLKAHRLVAKGLS